jgi:hypothetical protein
MNKTYLLQVPGYGTIESSKSLSSFEEASEAAKRKLPTFAAKGYDKIVIFESVAFVTTPTPQYEVTKIS